MYGIDLGAMSREELVGWRAVSWAVIQLRLIDVDGDGWDSKLDNIPNGKDNGS